MRASDILYPQIEDLFFQVFAHTIEADIVLYAIDCWNLRIFIVAIAYLAKTLPHWLLLIDLRIVDNWTRSFGRIENALDFNFLT